jgi:hypothetical protein
MNKFSHKDASGDIVQGISAGNISVDITTDGYPAETSWEIVGEDGTVYGSGGPYANQGPQPTVNVAVPGNVCVEFILMDSYGDGMCCANGVGAVLVQDANGTLIFEGDPVNLQNFSSIPAAFSTGAASGPAWECSPFGCVEGTPGLGIYMSESQCESDPTTGCYVGPTWDCDPLQGCIDVGTAGLGTYNTEQECIDDISNNCIINCIDTTLISPHSGQYTHTRSRGFWFQATSSYRITEVKAADGNTDGIFATNQSIEIIKFNNNITPFNYNFITNGYSNPHTSLFYARNISLGWVPCDVDIVAGEYYAIVGAKNAPLGNSFSNNGAFLAPTIA